MLSSQKRICKHENLRFHCSEHAQEVDFKPRTPLQRLAAVLPSNKAPKKADRHRCGPSEEDQPISTFPAPLVLPEDELSWNPTYEPQSFKSWLEEPARNEVTRSHRTIYLVPPPAIGISAQYVKGWSIPQTSSEGETNLSSPGFDGVLDYLKAFYHGMPVKLLTNRQLK